MLAELWARTLLHLNPDCDILCVDSCSPIRPIKHLAKYGFAEYIVNGTNDTFETRCANRVIARIDEDIGLLVAGGKDGAGQAFCKGIEVALANEYDWVVHIEGDLLFAKPVMPIVNNLAKHAIKVAAPLDYNYQFIEAQLLFMSVAWLREIDYLGTYDWRNRKPPKSRADLHEVWMEKLAGDELFILPLRGMRNDYDKLTVNNVEMCFPHGIDYLSHAKQFNLYQRFLTINGINPP